MDPSSRYVSRRGRTCPRPTVYNEQREHIESRPELGLSRNPRENRETMRSGIIVRVLAILMLAGLELGTLSATLAAPAPRAGATATPAVALPRGVTAAEQELANRYAPIAYLRTQPDECDTDGEPYTPVSVDITLNNPEVKLRRRKRPGEKHDPIIKRGPSAQDLVNTDGSYYLDLPGHTLDAGCVYEKWSRKRIEELGLAPSVYAHIATEPDRPGKLALQYWFYYAFDSFNNSHESDWEMIQLTFDADNAEQALRQDQPAMLSYAQHSGGENANWTDDNVTTENGHPVTYPAQGSHADYYQSAIWLAWAENGAGFGCDQSQEELTRVTLKPIVVPNDPDPNGPFAWLLFQGRWGEYHPWQFNGIKSPNLTKRWNEPISWTDDLRSVSYPVPSTETFGIGPAKFFCTLSTYGGDIARKVQMAPKILSAAIVVVIAILLIAVFLTRVYIWGGIKTYLWHIPVYLPASLLVLAISALTMWLDRLARHTLSSTWSGLDVANQFLLIALVAPGVIAVTNEITSDEPPRYVEAVRTSWRRIPVVFLALVYNQIILALMSLTIVLIPLAIYRQIQWAYTPHAVLLDGAGVRNARHVSRNIIKGDWARTLGMALLVFLIAGIPGPLIAMLLVIGNLVSLDVAGYISSAIYVIVYPMTIIATTLYYLERRKVHAEHVARALAGESPDENFWQRVREAMRRRPSPVTGEPLAMQETS